MMANLQELLDQKAALDKQIEATRKQERSDAIAQVKALMEQHGLSMADLGTKSAAKPSARKGGKVAAKYRNNATGETWSGRGLQPKWLKTALASGRSLSEFAL
jgi:DNA-binding protein H-NS